MTADAFETARELFELACDLPPRERAALLAERCAGSPELLRRVEELLALDGTPHPVFAGPPAALLDAGLGARVPPPALPARIGPYEIVRVLGVGGAGVVYEAVQPSLGRRVALKVLRTHSLSDELRRRFLREGRVLGRLHHPGIATIHEAGTATLDGAEHPFLAMELVEGERLDRFVREHGLDEREVVVLVARVADAVQHAHEAGVVHRDLKPANVLVGTDGAPRVLDFGIAHLTGADLSLATSDTLPGEILGTLPYMSPEQVRGDPSHLDQRADVYALGAVLVELLTGRPPHDVVSLPVVEAARRIVEDEPDGLGARDPRLRGDLETIAAKALEKEPARRYASAGQLAADLRRFLASEPILARPVSTIYQIKKFTRRNRVLVAGAVSTLAALVLGLVGTVGFALRAVDRADAAEVAEERAEAARAETVVRATEAEAAREQSDRERRRAVVTRNLLSDILLSAVPERGGRQTSIQEALRTSVAFVLENRVEDPEVEYYLCSNVAPVLVRLDDVEGAEDLYLRAIEVAGSRLADQPRLASRMRTIYANFLRDHGRKDEALEVWREILGDGEAPDVEDPAVWECLGDIGWELRSRGEFAEAVRFGELAVEHLERVGGTPNARMWAYFQLSNAHMFLHEDLEREVETAGRAVELLEQQGGLGRVVSGTQIVLQQANALDDAGRSDEAVALYEDLLERVVQWYGEDHADADTVRMNLGLALLNVGRFDEAVDLAVRVYEGTLRREGPGSEDTGNALRTALEAFLRAGRLEEGVEWSEGLLDERTPAFALEACHLLRGRLLAALGRPAEAVAELLPHVDAAAARVARGTEFVVEALRALVGALDEIGDPRVARYRDELARQTKGAEG